MMQMSIRSCNNAGSFLQHLGSLATRLWHRVSNLLSQLCLPLSLCVSLCLQVSLSVSFSLNLKTLFCFLLNVLILWDTPEQSHTFVILLFTCTLVQTASQTQAYCLLNSSLLWLRLISTPVQPCHTSFYSWLWGSHDGISAGCRDSSQVLQSES